MGIQPIVVRMLNITTENTGNGMNLSGPEGMAEFHRVDPHGVVMTYGGKQLSIVKEHLPILARYFGAAAILLGVELNEGWDKEQRMTEGS